MRSINKDIQKYITNFLDFQSLFNLHHSCKYFYLLLNEQYWKNKITEIFSMFGKDILVDDYKSFQRNANDGIYDFIYKKRYIIICKNIFRNNITLSVHNIIQDDDHVLLEYIELYHHIDLFKTFNSGNFVFNDGYNYSSEKFIRFIPIYEAIRKDSLNCFIYLFNKIEYDSKKRFQMYLKHISKKKILNFLNE